MGSKIITIFMFVIVLSAVVFFFRSGAIGGIFSIADKFPFSFRFPTSTVREPSTGGARTTDSRSVAARETAVKQVTEVKPVTGEKPAIDPRLIPEGFTAEDMSPYFRKARLSVSGSRITLRANVADGESIMVSGWTIQGKRSSKFVPRAVDIYEPSGFAPETDIYLRRGEYLYMYYGQSAIGVNLRPNMCTGYLENLNKFSPSLPKNCPNPVNDFDMTRVTGACQDYIRTLTSCRLPGESPKIPDTDYVCRTYLDQIHMRGCYERHRRDADFLSREWRAWIGSTFLDPLHDRVLLLDLDGKIVDVYEY